MINQQGTAVYVNDQQFQRSADTDGLRRFFSEMRLERDKAFLDEVKYVFQNGSQNRSYFFADIRYRDYASYERGISYMMPFYGVSGKVSAITSRVSYYTELLTCREEDLAGTGFTDLVFGTDYMRDSEGIAASKEEVVYKAREINPEFPGIIDLACFEIGRDFCHPTKPNCEECFMDGLCKKCI